MGQTFHRLLPPILSVLLFAAPFLAAAGLGETGGAVTTTISENTITTAGSLTLTLEASAPEDAGLLLPSPTETLGGFTIAGSTTSRQKLSPQPPYRIHQKLSLLLVPGLPGDYVIPPMSIATGGETIATRPITIQVHSVLPANTDTLQPRPPDAAVPVLNLPVLLIALATSAGALLILSLLVILLRRQRLRAPTDDAVKKNPAETASQALKALAQHARVEEIHRIAITYLSARLVPHADTMTLGDAAGQPSLEAYLRCFESCRFSSSPATTQELRTALERLIAEGASR